MINKSLVDCPMQIYKFAFDKMQIFCRFFLTLHKNHTCVQLFCLQISKNTVKFLHKCNLMRFCVFKLKAANVNRFSKK